MAETMRAAVFPEYGRLDLVEVREVDMPAFGDGQMLVRVRAAGFNAIDWRWLTGTPILLLRRRGGWRRPKFQRLGADFAGLARPDDGGRARARPPSISSVNEWVDRSRAETRDQSMSEPAGL